MNDPAVVHQQAASVVADAVIQLTERAVKPTFQPFTKELKDITKELRERLDSIDGAHRDFRKLASDLEARMTELTAELTTELTALAARVARLEQLQAGTAQGVSTELHYLGSLIGQVQSQVDTSARSSHAALSSLKLVAVRSNVAIVAGIALGLAAELALLLR